MIPTAKVYKYILLETKNRHALAKLENGQYTISLEREEDIKREYYPSKVISRVLGVELHTEWDVSFLKNESLRTHTKYSNANYQKLLNYNPVLSKLDSDCCVTDYDKKSLFHGAISKFNKDDIKYFLSFECYDRPTWVMELQRAIEDHLKLSFQWVLSYQTSNIIITAIHEGKIKGVDLSLNNLNFY